MTPVPGSPGPCRSPETSARVHAEVRAATDVIRLQACGSGLAGKPIFVVTLRALVDARRHLGDDATDLAMFSRIAEIQGSGVEWGRLGHLGHSRAKGLARSMLTMPSFARSDLSCVFLDERDCTETDNGDGRWHSGRIHVDRVLYHEIGHIAQGTARIALPHGFLRDLPPGLREVCRRHDRECFADAFAVGAMARSGYPLEEVASAVLSASAACLSSRAKEQGTHDPYWRDRPEWKAIYLTAGAVHLAVRRSTRGDGTPLGIATESRPGAFSPDVLAGIMQDRYPDTLAGFDPSGYMVDRARRHDSLEIGPVPDFRRYDDPVDDLVSFHVCRSGMIHDGFYPDPGRSGELDRKLREACLRAAFPGIQTGAMAA